MQPLYLLPGVQLQPLYLLPGVQLQPLYLLPGVQLQPLYLLPGVQLQPLYLWLYQLFLLQVWEVRVDVHVLDHCGNIIDCVAIATLTALKHFR